MKTLFESLLDDEDILMQNSDDAVNQQAIEQFVKGSDTGFDCCSFFRNSKDTINVYNINFNQLTLNDFTKEVLHINELQYLTLSASDMKLMEGKWDFFPRTDRIVSLYLTIDKDFKKIDLSKLRTSRIDFINIQITTDTVPTDLDKKIILPKHINTKFNSISIKAYTKMGGNSMYYKNFDYAKLKKIETYQLYIHNAFLNIINYDDFRPTLIKDDRTKEILDYIFNKNVINYMVTGFTQNYEDVKYWVEKSKTKFGYKLKKIR